MSAEPTPSSSPSSSFSPSNVGEREDHRASTSSQVSDPEKASRCPRCSTPFTTTFRRHHCRNCAGLVCDDCSRHRMRVPTDPSAGNVRVCDACALTIGESHAASMEEDVDISSEIVAQLRGALSKSYKECEAYKRVLLELDSIATGDNSLLDQHSRDPESPEFSFSALQEKVQNRWSSVLASLEVQKKLKLELEERQLLASKRSSELDEKEEELLVRRAELDADLAEVSKIEAERDELFRQEAELESAVATARRRVRELELGRKEQQERDAERERTGHGRRSWTMNSFRSPPGSPPQGPVAFTISTGRRDPLLANSQNSFSQRLEGCRRLCSLM